MGSRYSISPVLALSWPLSECEAKDDLVLIQISLSLALKQYDLHKRAVGAVSKSSTPALFSPSVTVKWAIVSTHNY